MLKHKTLTRRLKIMFAAHHHFFNSEDIGEIATVVNMPSESIEKMMDTSHWDEALHYWSCGSSKRDLKLAEYLWERMIETGEHINPVEYPEKPIDAPQAEGDPAVYPLIQSHLFCVDNLSADDIQKRLADDGDPVRYLGYPIRGYHWFVYPNDADGIYSKVLARVNAVGDLVIDFGDRTCLVCIRHGRLSLTRQVSNDVANVADERLLVCL